MVVEKLLESRVLNSQAPSPGHCLTLEHRGPRDSIGESIYQSAYQNLCTYRLNFYGCLRFIRRLLLTLQTLSFPTVSVKAFIV